MFTQQSRARRRVGSIGMVGAAALAVTALVGCSSGGGGNPDATTTLDILLHSNPSTDKALTEMTAAFEEENPDISVNLDFVPTNDLPATRTARVAAGDVDITEGSIGVQAQPLPDYVVDTPESDWVRGVEAGNWLEFTDEPFMENYLPDVVDALAIDGRSYQVPTSLNYYTGIYYNKALFDEAGIDEAPTTWSEFQDAVDSLNEAGIIPISIGGKDSWPVGLISMASLQSAYPSVEERVQLEQDIWAGDVQWDSPEIIEVMDKVKYVFDNADPTFAGVDYATAEGQFAGGQVAMTLDGTWAAVQFMDTNPALEMGFFPFPGSEDAEDNSTLGGKIDFTFAVPSSADDPEAAVKWIEYFSQPDAYATFTEVGGIIPAQADVPLAPALSVVEPYLSEFTLGWGDLFHGNTTASPTLNYVGLAPMGTSETVEEAQRIAQEVWVSGEPAE